MPNYAILRTKKLNSWSGISGSMNHTYRRVETPNADPVRLGKNQVLVGSPNNGETDLKRRIDDVTSNPRKNAVLAIEFLLTASPEWFVGKSEKQIRQWANKNIEFLQSKYGKENVCHAVLHRDESSPHIVAYIVPEHAGKLNCRELLGGRSKLTQLQTDYAAAMSPMKLVRGLEGSRSKHTTIKEFYGGIDKAASQSKAEFKRLKKPILPPEYSLKTLVSKDSRNRDLEQWRAAEIERNKRVIRIASSSISKVEILEKQVRSLKHSNHALTIRNETLEERLSTLYESLDLSKDAVVKLRKLDISSVAERLSYFDEIKKNENAIDLVMRVNEFKYPQAVAWLYNEFDAASTAAEIKNHLEKLDPVRPLTKAERTISAAVKTQLNALGCDKFRLSLIDDGLAPYLPGKNGQEEHFYSKEEILGMVPYLRYENNHGKHIFITPMDDHAYYVLIDDLRVTQEQLLEKGYKPCLIQDTSWGSQQAVLKVSKQGVDRRSVIDFFNQINKSIGDKSITGLRHPFRLAGFRNLKPKHEKNGLFPFVTIRAAINRFCKKSYDLIVKQEIEKRDLLEPKPRLNLDGSDQTVTTNPIVRHPR